MAVDNHGLIKVERVVRTALGLLEREVVLPGLVWRDAGGSFRGAKNDTISLRLPAYATASTRGLRSATAYGFTDLDETKVDVTLDTDVYKAVRISDEQLTLDIESLGEQVLSPIVSAVARKVEEELGATMSSATYAFDLTVNATDPVETVIRARKLLNKANVPAGGRRLVVGADVEELLLNDERLQKVNESGSDSALREARVGKLAGVDVFTTNSIPADEAYMFHNTAYVLSLQAPMVPDGVSYGASESFAGLAMRVIRDYDMTAIQDRLVCNTYMGTNTVADRGVLEVVDPGIDDTPTGKFTPSETGADPQHLVRAVKLSLGA